MSEFQTVRKRGRKPPTDPTIPIPQNFERLQSDFNKKVAIIEISDLFKETIDSLANDPWGRIVERIRCIALGSPSQDSAALFQLAYVYALSQNFSTKSVSLFDPAFNELDTEFLTKTLKYEISQEDQCSSGENVLYFLPHAPLNLTEEVLNNSKPRLLLANDVIAHGDRLTKRELHNKYKTLSLLSNSATLYMASIGEDIVKAAEVDKEGFNSVPRTKKRRTNKRVYVEEQIEYDYEECYFNKCQLTRFKHRDGLWGNAFTDLSLHILD